MRILILLVCCAITISAAYWAYSENYKTQATLKRISHLQSQIAEEREAISILNAEWAYLNRPERLRDLVDLNFNDLLLVPLSSDHFGEAETIAYPRQPDLRVSDPVDTVGELPGESAQ
jgi:hypothetical protein